MRLNDALGKWGTSASALLAERREPAPSALATVRRAAARGRVLEPPPALRHEAPFHAPNVLWGAEFSLHHTSEATAYREGAFRVPRGDEDAAATTYEVLGSLMFDVTRSVSRPALLYWSGRRNDEVHEGRADEAAQAPEPQLLVVVDHAPLGAMEAELFDARPGGSCSELEAEWLGERGVAQWAVRTTDLATTVRSGPGGAGFAAFPNWLLGGTYHVVRPGVLPLLRLRLPRDQAECRALRRALRRARPSDDWTEDHIVMPDALLPERWALSDAPVNARTVFQARAGPAPRGAPDDDPMSADEPPLAEETCLSARLLAPLARLVLFRLRDGTPAYYGLDDAAAPAPHYGGAVLQQANTKLAFTDEDAASHARASECRKPATVVENERELKLVAWRTGRVCRADVVGRPTDLEDAMACVADALFSASDAAIVIETLRESRAARTASQPFDAAPRPRLRDGFDAVGRLLRSDQLLLYSDVEDGLVVRTGVAGGGLPLHYELGVDDIVRLALCSWVTHVLYDGRSVMHDVQGVSRLPCAVSGGAPGARGGAQGGRWQRRPRRRQRSRPRRRTPSRPWRRRPRGPA